MKPNPKFSNLPKSFWATVRSVSQEIGYTIRGEGQVKVPTVEEISDALGHLLGRLFQVDDLLPTFLQAVGSQTCVFECLGQSDCHVAYPR